MKSEEIVYTMIIVIAALFLCIYWWRQDKHDRKNEKDEFEIY